jgi:uncharacterized protein (DUF1015 family)
VEVTDEYGVLHRLWRISDPPNIRLLCTAMADKKLIIADGHHRYETALSYSRECTRVSTTPAEHSTSQLPQPDYPEAAVMMTFVNMDSDGLVILPTHRVVHGLAGFDPGTFVRTAEEFFATKPLPEAEPEDWISTLTAQEGTAFIAVTRSGPFLLRLKPLAASELSMSLPEHERQLDLCHLHNIVLDRLLGFDAEKIREQTNIRYLRDASEAVDQVQRGEADVAFLTKPVTIEQLREVAFAGSVMPQKSTDFYPKLLSGLTIYALE